jgi:superfamily II DNA or RNA helicase
MKALRPYQADVLERASAASAEHQSILIVQPTGTGKTVVAVEACHRHVVRSHGRPMFVAPRRELVQQARAALAERGLEEGHDVFVRTIQELTMKGAQGPARYDGRARRGAPLRRR